MRPTQDDLVSIFANVANGFPSRRYLRRKPSVIGSRARTDIQRGQPGRFEQQSIKYRLDEPGGKWRSPKLQSARPRIAVPGNRRPRSVLFPHGNPWEECAWERIPSCDPQLRVEHRDESCLPRRVQQHRSLVTFAFLVERLSQVAASTMCAGRNWPPELLVLRQQIFSIETVRRRLPTKAGD